MPELKITGYFSFYQLNSIFFLLAKPVLGFFSVTQMQLLQV